MRTLNTALLTRTMTHIDDNPEEHDQAYWFNGKPDTECGTTMCFAGHAAILAGAQRPDPDTLGGSVWCVNEATGVLDPFGVSVADFAQNALGLTQAQAHALFFRAANRSDLRAMVAMLIHNRAVGYAELSLLVGLDDQRAA